VWAAAILAEDVRIRAQDSAGRPSDPAVLKAPGPGLIAATTTGAAAIPP
jgi:hypothetical protein